MKDIPERWSIAVDSDNWQSINLWRHACTSYKALISDGYLDQNGRWNRTPFNDVITYEQFEKYVLLKDNNEELLFEDFSYLIDFLKKLKIT